MTSTKSLLVRNKFLWAAIAWTLFVTYSCLTGSSQIPKVSWLAIQNKDKIAHFIFYFTFTILWYLYIRSKHTAGFKKAVLIPFFMAVFYGAFIEACQGLFTDSRDADVMDALANTVGSAVGVLVLRLVQNKKR